MLLCMLGGFGGGSRLSDIRLKRNGGSMSVTRNPLAVLGGAERALFQAKTALLKSFDTLRTFDSAANLVELSQRIGVATKQLFPNAGLILLLKRGTEYHPFAIVDVPQEVDKLNLSARNSIVRSAGEDDPYERRTIYIPDLRGKGIYLGFETDRMLDSARIETKQYEIEEGEIEKSGYSFDLISLRHSGVPAMAVSPISVYQHTDPVGAIVLTGNNSFLNPMMDLLILRNLSSKIAHPLQAKLA